MIYFRLNLSEGPAKSGRASSVRRTPIKAVRKRVLLEESEEQTVEDDFINDFAKGDIEISDVCVEGKYVKIHNKGKKVSTFYNFKYIYSILIQL